MAGRNEPHTRRGDADLPDRGPLPDGVPKRHLYDEPLHVQSVEALPPEPLDDDRVRVTFWVNVRDRAGRPGRELAVEARIVGPERTGRGVGNTDEHGQVRFRTTGPRGSYRCEIVDVAAGAIDVERGADGLVARLDVDV